MSPSRLEHLLRLVDDANEAVAVADDDRRLVAVNRMASDLLGRSREALTGMRIDDLLERVDGESLDGIWARFLETGSATGTYRMRRGDGSVVQIETRSQARFVPGRHVSFFRDVTASRAAEAALQEAQAVAQAAEHAKAAFLGAMSHELRTPLGTIIGFAELLEDERAGPLTERQRRYVTNIRESGMSLLVLVEQILDIGKAASGRAPLSIVNADIVELLRDVAMLARPLAGKRGVNVAVAADAEVTIGVDVPRLKQALFVLLVMLQDHADRESTVQVRVEALGDDRVALLFEARPAGPAMDAVAALREAFARVASGAWLANVADRIASLGLACLLVEQHGGEVRPTIAADRMQVRVSLPVRPRLPGARPSPAHPSRLPAALAGPRVLIVERDAATAELLGQFLDGTGCYVVHAPTAAEALTHLDAGRPAVIVVDPVLSDAAGPAVIDDLRRRAGAGVPLIELSHEPTAGAGATWLRKPVGRADFLRVLEPLIRGAGAAGAGT